MKKLILCLCVVALYGCGGGGGGNLFQGVYVDNPPHLVPCAPIATAKVQLFGDSTMWGYDGAAGNGTRASIYPELVLQQAFDAAYGTGVVHIETRAVAGTTTTNLIQGTDGVNLPWPQSVNADVVVINFGINDKYIQIPVATYEANLKTLATVPSPTKVLFQTPLPVWYASGLSLSYAQEMRDVAAELSLPVAEASAFALTAVGIGGYDAPDGVHPNSNTYRLLGENVLIPAVDKIIRPLICGA